MTLPGGRTHCDPPPSRRRGIMRHAIYPGSAETRALSFHLLRVRRTIVKAHRLIIPADRHDAVAEAQADRSPAQLVHFKRARRPVRHIQPLAVTIRREEHLILLARVD